MPLKIFLSYAHEDEKLKKELEKHLSLLKRQALIDVWHDRDISAGMEWEQENRKYLKEADIILLLVSPDFINSDNCYTVETQEALERHKQGEVRVIPVILRPVDWENTPFGQLKALPVDGKPIKNRSNRDEAFKEVAQSIREIIEDKRPFKKPEMQSQEETFPSPLSVPGTSDYSEERFQQDKKRYIQWLEQRYRILKLNIVSHLLEKDASTYKDPDISSMFVPFQAKLHDKELTDHSTSVTVIELLLKLRKEAERWGSRDIPRHLVLLGGPGQGKSTLIQYLVWCHAASNLPQPSTLAANVSFLPWNPIPLHIDLSQISKFKRAGQDSFLSCVIKILQTQGVKAQNTHQMFERILDQEETLLLFDGLDEATQERQFVIEGIEELARNYSKSTIIVTSRIIGYYTRKLSTTFFYDAEIQSFDKNQVRLFLKNWYKYVLRSLQEDTEQEQDTFHNRLVSNPRLFTLAANPLLLTIMAALYHLNPKALPNNRIQIYEQCARTLLEHWTKVRGSSIEEREALVMSKHEQYLCAAQLGYEIHQYAQRREEEAGARGIRTLEEFPSSNVSAEFIQRKIESFIKNRYPSISWSKQAEAFFELMQLDAGLIIKRGTDEIGEALYGFVHRTFQEYFAAVDIYKRYHNNDNPNPAVIRDFLGDCLHDPYWYEVILLFFEKLERKVVIEQLRQILEGKIKSRRSQYTDVVQQNLFFVCQCLNEDIAVDKELAENVVSRLSNLVKNSPFPSQSDKSIQALVSLERTQHYANLARKELTVLTTQWITLDRLKKVLPNYGWQLDNQPLLNLLQHLNTPFEQAMQAAQLLCVINPFESKEQQQAIQMLLKLVQRLDLSTEQIVRVAKFVYANRPYKSEEWQQATQMLLNQAEQPNLSVEQVIQIAQTLNESPPKSNECEQATRLLLKIVQRAELSIEQTIEIAGTLFSNPIGSEGEEQATQMILDLAKQPMSIDKAEQIIQNLCQFINLRRWMQGMKLLLDLAQQPNIPLEKAILVAQALKECSQEVAAWQLLLDLSMRPDLSIEQSVLIAQTLYDCDPIFKGMALGKNLARQRLSSLEERSDLSIEQSFLVAEAITKCYPTWLQGEQRAHQLLLNLVHREDLSIEQLVQIAETFQPYQYKKLLKSEDIKYISQRLMDSIESTDLPFEQLVHNCKVLDLFSYHNEEVQQYAYQKFSQLAQRSDLSLSQNLEVVINLYQYSHYRSSERQQVTKETWQLAHDERLTLAQRLSVIEPILAESDVAYVDKVQAVRIVNTLLRKEQAKQYLEEHWHMPFSGENVEPVDIPYMIELVSQKLLPTEVLDRMYRLLDYMVPQFDKIPTSIDHLTP